MYVSFLRAINVGGKNHISMEALKETYEALGFKDVVTYLNTGNIIFMSDYPEQILEELIHTALIEHYDLNIDVIVKSQASIIWIAEQVPFQKEQKNRYVTLFKKEVSGDFLELLKPYKAELDEIVLKKDVCFMSVPGGYGKTKLTNGLLEKIIGVPATTRNMNTIEKIILKMNKKNV